MKKLLLLIFILVVGSLSAAEVSGLRVRIIPQRDEVEPSVLFFEASKGESYKRRFTLENRTENKVRVRLYATDASNSDEGALVGPLFGEANSGTGTWVSLSHQTVELQPGESERVTCEVAVPSEARSGDHVGFIYIESAREDEAPTDQAEQFDESTFTVKMKLRFGLPILARVDGHAMQPILDEHEVKKVYREGSVGFEETIPSGSGLALRVQRELTLISPTGETVFASTFKGYLLPEDSLRLWTPIATELPLARGSYRLQVKTTATIPNRTTELENSFEQELTLP